MLPDDSIVNNVNVYDPCYITFSNLRQYVVAMSTTDTPLDHRTYFYDHSPIPNASWTVTMVGDGTEGGQIRSPTLSNPDEIMPDQYGMADLISDIKIIMTAVTIVERIYPNFTSRERIDYTAKGHPRQLTSCTASEIRCTDIGNDYAISDAISGNCDFYWSLGNLSSSVLFPGYF
uniref:Uncharacterized protein n=1 Tax=Anopheles culicifacies TaxID=139723 RepID=A0A182MRV9_9DIPT